MKYFLKIFGCQMNYSDAERITSFLEKYKFKPAASIEAADFVVFVTCGVRQSAENRVYGLISNLYQNYPKKIAILTGCLAHRKDVQLRLKDKVNLFTTIKEFPKEIQSLALRNSKSSARRRKKPSFSKKDYLNILPKHVNNYTAYVPIMTGCNNFCTYCVVPYARGREYSRPTEDILKEAKSLIKNGYKEIVLLGQNVNSYKSQKVNFPKLLQLIEKIPVKFWLTFLTSHPKDMSEDLIKTIAKCKKICEYISLPAQSGDNEILRRMNRHYTVAHYKNLIKNLKLSFRKSESLALGKLPLSVSTDIIVGFPGETKKHFENTGKLFREIKFDMAYINQYSPRPETAAWKLRDNVSKKEKSRREKVLTTILKKTALENNKKYIGKAVEVLVDKMISSKLNENLALEQNTYLAHTRTQKKVKLYSNKKIPIGNFAKIKITKVKAFSLEGEII